MTINQRANDLRRTIRQRLRIDPSEVQEPKAVSGGQEANEEIRDMCRALVQMSENTRAVVLLAGCHQLSYSEIVDRLKIPIGTVRSRLARGRRFLREFMAGEHISSRNVHTIRESCQSPQVPLNVSAQFVALSERKTCLNTAV